MRARESSAALRASQPRADRVGRGKRAGCLVMRAYHVVLAVKDEAADGLAACGGHRSLTAVRGVIRDAWAIPPTIIEDSVMNAIVVTSIETQARQFRSMPLAQLTL